MTARRMLVSLVWATLLCAPAASQAATQIGVAAAVRGSVQVLRSPAVGTALQSGAKLYLGDKVTTGPGAGMQILLLDETVFTLGPNSELMLDTFVYDPATADGKVDAKLVKGAFRFISGRVARKDPRQMNVALPSGTIGIRGTIVYALVDGEQGSATVVLAGPGEANTTGETAGAIEVTNAGASQDVLRSGWGVQIAGFDQPPSEPFPAPEGFFESFQFEVAAAVADATPGGDEDSGDETAAEDSTESASSADGTADADADSEASADEPTSDSSPTSEAGAQLETASVALQADAVLTDSLGNVELPLPDPVMPDSTQPPPPAVPAFTNTLVSELEALAGTFTGTYVYDAFAQPLASGGSYDLSVNLDFSRQMVQATLKNVDSVPLSIAASAIGFGTSSTGFKGAFPEARYDMIFPYTDSPSLCIASDCTAEVKLLFENKDAAIAAVVSSELTLTQSRLQTQDTGVAFDVPVRVVP